MLKAQIPLDTPATVAQNGTFENMTVDMVDRVPASDAVASVVERSPLGHGPDQWFGAEFAPTGGVDQNFGGRK